MGVHMLFVCLFFVWSSFQGVSAEDPVCGVFEEGTQGALTCSTTASQFWSLQPRIEINGEYAQFGSCDSEGRECSSQPGYLTALSSNQTASTKSVTLYVDRMRREMKRSRCYKDYIVMPSLACSILVYVKPNKPTCQPPVFVEGGSAVLITCKSTRVFPEGICEFLLEGGNPTTTVATPRSLTTITENTNSDRYPGDQEVTCRLHIPVTGFEEFSYRIAVGVSPDLNGMSESATVISDQLPPLTLKATALYTPEESGHLFHFLNFEKLHIDIPVTGNPPPNRISLKVKHEHAQTMVPFSSLDYTTFYNSTAGPDGGVVVLVLSKSLKKKGHSHYTLSLSNGVIGSQRCEYNFTVNGTQEISASLPTQPQAEKGENPLMFFLGLGGVAFGVLLVLLVAIHFAVRKVRQNKNTHRQGETSNVSCQCSPPRAPLPSVPPEDGRLTIADCSDPPSTAGRNTDVSTMSSRLTIGDDGYAEPYVSVRLQDPEPSHKINHLGLNLATPVTSSSSGQQNAPCTRDNAFFSACVNDQSPQSSAQSYVVDPEVVKNPRYTQSVDAVQGAPENCRRRSLGCALRLWSIPASGLLTDLSGSFGSSNTFPRLSV